MIENLATLANSKSLLAESVETYLRETRKNLNKLEWCFDNKNLQVDQLHIEQFLILERLKEIPRFDSDKDRKDFDSRPQNWGVEITNQAKLYELTSNASQREQVRWSQKVNEHNLKLVIIGSPGSGKSFTTKHLILEKIEVCLYRIDNNICDIDDLELPIWITATDLVSQNTTNPVVAIKSYIQKETSHLALTSSFHHFVSSKIEAAFGKNQNSEKAPLTIVIDSLDELPDDKKDEFKEITKHFEKTSIRLILTCRTLQWEERSSWVGFTPKEKVELAPLKPFQQKEFTDRFFANRDDLRETMRTLLDGNFALSNAFTTPLLITFGALLHGNKELTESTTYVEIYEKTVTRIFGGVWRKEKPYWASSSVSLQRHLGLLEKICWHLFLKNPEKNLFNLEDWTEASKTAKTIEEEKEINTDTFLEELLKLGFISKANFYSKEYSFSHRTFLEFLSASQLAKLPNRLEIARSYFWFAPEWLECLTFMAGLLEVEDVRKLIAAVRSEKNDIFGSMIFLEAKLIGASKLTKIEDIQHICDLIVCVCINSPVNLIKNLEHKPHFNEFDRNWLIYRNQTLYFEFINLVARNLLLNLFCKNRLLNYLDKQSYLDGWGILTDDDADDFMSNYYDIVYVLNKELTIESLDPNVRKYAALALVEDGYFDDEIIEILLASLQPNDSYGSVAKGLLKICNQRKLKKKLVLRISKAITKAIFFSHCDGRVILDGYYISPLFLISQKFKLKITWTFAVR